jgi:hypothetical protein
MTEPFVVNVSEAPAYAHPQAGIGVSFEDPANRFPDFGLEITMLEAGQPGAQEVCAARSSEFTETTMPWPPTG